MTIGVLRECTACEGLGSWETRTGRQRCDGCGGTGRAWRSWQIDNTLDDVDLARLSGRGASIDRVKALTLVNLCTERREWYEREAPYVPPEHRTVRLWIRLTGAGMDGVVAEVAELYGPGVFAVELPLDVVMGAALELASYQA